MLPAQQPPEHEVALQMHWPEALHACPAAHPPHAAPPAPHAANDCAEYPSHVPASSQQPFAHVVGSHAHVPFVVSQRPFGHVPHCAPPRPHWFELSDE